LNSLGGIVFVREVRQAAALPSSRPDDAGSIEAPAFSDYDLSEPMAANALGHADASGVALAANPDSREWLTYN